MRKFGVHPNWGLARLNYKILAAMIIVHVMAIATPLFFSWSGLVIAVIIGTVSGFGITICYHRLLTHGSFKTYQWMKQLLTLIATLSWEGGPLTWVGTHRIHHKYSDQEGDPHTPNHGFDWAHMGWMLVRTPEGQNALDYTRDLQKDPWMLWIQKYFWVSQVVLTIVLYALGYLTGGTDLAVSWVIMGVGLRTTVIFHWTWLINSLAHTWGYRNFETKDGSRNLPWILSIITIGEGYHNNHHRYQKSAAHGLKPREVDLTYLVIKILEKVGLAWDVFVPDRDKIKYDSS